VIEECQSIAAVRKAISLFLVVLLLAPPGFCVCRLEAFVSLPKEPKAASASVRPLASCGCRNPKCRNHRASDQKPAKGVARVNDSQSDPSSAPDHAPGCPASPSYVLGRGLAVESAIHLDLMLCCQAYCLLGSTPLVAGHRFAAYFDFLPVPIVPLYLLGCDFRC
jgi:hypothetical protein